MQPYLQAPGGFYQQPNQLQFGPQLGQVPGQPQFAQPPTQTPMFPQSPGFSPSLGVSPLGAGQVSFPPMSPAPNPQASYQIPYQTPTAPPMAAMPQKKIYRWNQKTGKMQWGLAESIDVDNIARNGDITSALFYMDKFVNATFTKTDLEQFGSKGALNAFLILQLGAEYLLSENAKLVAELNTRASQTNEADKILVAKYEEEKRKAEEINRNYVKTNGKLTEQIAELKKQKQELVSKFKVLKKKYLNVKSKNKKGASKQPPPVNEDSEPGALHETTDLREFQKHKQNLDIGKSKAKKKPTILISDSDSGSISEGEIAPTTLIQTQNNDEYDDEYEEDDYEADEYDSIDGAIDIEENSNPDSENDTY